MQINTIILFYPIISIYTYRDWLFVPKHTPRGSLIYIIFARADWMETCARVCVCGICGLFKQIRSFIFLFSGRVFDWQNGMRSGDIIHCQTPDPRTWGPYEQQNDILYDDRRAQCR